jgi:hypothetical protein
MAEQIKLDFLEFIKSSFSLGNKYIKCPLDIVKDQIKFFEINFDQLTVEHIQSTLLKHANVNSKTTYVKDDIPRIFTGFLVLQRQTNNFNDKNYKLEENLIANP